LALVEECKGNILDRNKNGQTLWHSCLKGFFQYDLAEFLISKKVDINAIDNEGTAPIHLTCQQGWDYVDLVVSYVTYGAKIMAKDNKGQTALHFAAAKGYRDIMEYLFQIKFDVNVKDNSGGTPLHLAAESKYSPNAAVLLLLQMNGADIGAQGPML